MVNILRYYKKDGKNIYLYEKSKSGLTLYIYSLKENKEIAFISLKDNTIYFNEKYKNNFISIKKELKKQYNNFKINSYCEIV